MIRGGPRGDEQFQVDDRAPVRGDARDGADPGCIGAARLIAWMITVTRTEP